MRNLARALSHHGYVPLRRDLTRTDSTGWELLRRADRTTIPVIVFVDPTGRSWAEELGEVLERMRRREPRSAD